MKKIETEIKITNAKQLIKVLEEIVYRAKSQYIYSINDGYFSYKNSVLTLIKVLKETK